MFKKQNLNPKNKKTSDCVIRSFASATGKSWDDTYSDLCDIGFKIKSMPNDKTVYTVYAESLGFEKCKIELSNGHKPTVKSFADNHPSGIFILRLAGHLVTVIDGDYIDSWDCGYKSVYMYWKVA